MIKLTWKPVLQALALKEYHPDYGEERIMICVNPTPEFMAEYSSMRDEYAARYFELNRLTTAAASGSEEDQLVARQQAIEKDQECTSWVNDIYMPGINDWYARLWSYGDDKYTAADLAEFNKIDPHFLTWAKVRTITMIDDHARARKKA